MGYAGGTIANPTYYRMGDHTETFQVDFDPTVISYANILRLFWQSHNPQRKAWSRQYMAVILYHKEAQREQAEQSKAALKTTIGRSVKTKILPLTQFYLAEDYHQKYRLQNTTLLEEVKTIYPHMRDWVDSTAAARLNGYLSGYGIAETFATDIEQLGLSMDGKLLLQKLVGRQGASLTCPVR